MIATFHEYSNLLEANGDLAASDAIFPRAVCVGQGVGRQQNAGAKCYSMALSGAFSDLAWTLMRRSPERHGDPALALQLARFAAGWQPDRCDLQLTLGVGSLPRSATSRKPPRQFGNQLT